MLEDTNTGVGGSKIDTDSGGFRHFELIWKLTLLSNLYLYWHFWYALDKQHTFVQICWQNYWFFMVHLKQWNICFMGIETSLWANSQVNKQAIFEICLRRCRQSQTFAFESCTHSRTTLGSTGSIPLKSYQLSRSSLHMILMRFMSHVCSSNIFSPNNVCLILWSKNRKKRSGQIWSSVDERVIRCAISNRCVCL